MHLRASSTSSITRKLRTYTDADLPVTTVSCHHEAGDRATSSLTTSNSAQISLRFCRPSFPSGLPRGTPATPVDHVPRAQVPDKSPNHSSTITDPSPPVRRSTTDGRNVHALPSPRPSSTGSHVRSSTPIHPLQSVASALVSAPPPSSSRSSCLPSGKIAGDHATYHAYLWRLDPLPPELPLAHNPPTPAVGEVAEKSSTEH